jgi:hypothetical protein
MKTNRKIIVQAIAEAVLGLILGASIILLLFSYIA